MTGEWRETPKSWADTFWDDVIKRPSIGPLTGLFLTTLFVLIVYVTLIFAPDAAQRASEAHGANPRQGIPVQISYLTIGLVAALAILTGIEPIIEAPLTRWRERMAVRFTPHGRIGAGIGRGLYVVIGWPLWFLYRAPAVLINFVDFVLVRFVAVIAGAKLQPWPLRYGVFLFWLLASIAIGVNYEGVGPLLAVCAGMVAIIAMVRRWLWIERDREAFLVERRRPSHERIGFDEDLRDEALIGITFLLALIPVGLRQLDLIYPDAFVLAPGRAMPETLEGELLAWMAFFGGELTKVVPLVDWSEVFHVANNAALRPKSALGYQVVFAMRSALDLLFIAAVLQAVGIAARLRDQEVAFAKQKLTVFDPFRERRHFQRVSREADNHAFLDLTDNPSQLLKHRYSKERLIEITAGYRDDGVAERSKIMRDPVARSAAVLALGAQYGIDTETQNAMVAWVTEDRDLFRYARYYYRGTVRRLARVSLLLARRGDDRIVGPVAKIASQLQPDVDPDVVMDIAHAAGLLKAAKGSVDERIAAAREILPSHHHHLADMAIRYGLDDAPSAFIKVEKGASFMMGSDKGEPGAGDSEQPRHQVTFKDSFAIGRFAVTFDDYDAFCRATDRSLPGDRGWGRGRRPVINVSYDDARAYCAWLSEKLDLAGDRVFRLPTEAEWEYACRAGTTTLFSFDNVISTDLANYDGNYTFNGSEKGEYRRQTLEVGALPPNPFGLFEMHGNVWEWCADAWNEDYDQPGRPDDGSAWMTGEMNRRVVRGGSWYGDPQFLRSAYRDFRARVSGYYRVGFRLARTL